MTWHHLAPFNQTTSGRSAFVKIYGLTFFEGSWWLNLNQSRWNFSHERSAQASPPRRIERIKAGRQRSSLAGSRAITGIERKPKSPPPRTTGRLCRAKARTGGGGYHKRSKNKDKRGVHLKVGSSRDGERRTCFAIGKPHFSTLINGVAWRAQRIFNPDHYRRFGKDRTFRTHHYGTVARTRKRVLSG